MAILVGLIDPCNEDRQDDLAGGAPSSLGAGGTAAALRSCWHTSTNLLRQLKESPTHLRWTTFYRRYAPLILSFARRCGCDYHQAEDVLQETMMRLMKALPKFDYDHGKGKFRAYLLKIVQNVVWTELGRKKRNREIEVDVHGLAGDACLAMEKEWEDAWRAHLMSQALQTVRSRVGENTFESFKLYALEGIPADRVAATLAIDRNVVYQHRNRVIRLLSEEVSRLRETEERGDAGKA